MSKVEPVEAKPRIQVIKNLTGMDFTFRLDDMVEVPMRGRRAEGKTRLVYKVLDTIEIKGNTEVKVPAEKVRALLANSKAFKGLCGGDRPKLTVTDY